jgi:hypothetical protein
MLEGWGSIAVKGDFFSLRHNTQTGSGAHTTSYSIRTGIPSSEVKRPGSEANHSHQSSA